MYCRFVLLGMAFTLLLCCADSNQVETNAKKKSQAFEVSPTVSDLEPTLAGADSVQLIFYDDPYGDSLRYSRYFTYTGSAEPLLVKTLWGELDQVYTQAIAMRPCRSEGKLILLRGEDVLKTIYFTAKSDTCRSFYFIKNGLFFYFPLTKKAQQILAEKKKEARKPALL